MRVTRNTLLISVVIGIALQSFHIHATSLCDSRHPSGRLVFEYKFTKKSAHHHLLVDTFGLYASFVHSQSGKLYKSGNIVTLADYDDAAASICLYIPSTMTEVNNLKDFVHVVNDEHLLIYELSQYKDELLSQVKINDHLKKWQSFFKQSNDTDPLLINAIWNDIFNYLRAQKPLALLKQYYEFYTRHIPEQYLTSAGIKQAQVHLIERMILDFSETQTEDYLRLFADRLEQAPPIFQFHHHRLWAMHLLYQNRPDEAKPHFDSMETLLNVHKLYSVHHVSFWDLKGHYALTQAKFAEKEKENWFALALEYELKASQILVSNADSVTAARVFNNIGWILRKQQRLNDALASYSLALVKHDDSQQQTLSMYLYKNMAEIYLSLGDVGSAQLFLDESLKYANLSAFWKTNLECRLHFSKYQIGTKGDQLVDLRDCLTKLADMRSSEHNPMIENAYITLLVSLFLHDTFYPNFHNGEDIKPTLNVKKLKARSTAKLDMGVEARLYLAEAIQLTDNTDSKKQGLFEKALASAANSEDISLLSDIAIMISTYCFRTNQCAQEYAANSIDTTIDAIAKILSLIRTSDLNIHFVNRVESFLSLLVDQYASQNKINKLLELNALIGKLAKRKVSAQTKHGNAVELNQSSTLALTGRYTSANHALKHAVNKQLMSHHNIYDDNPNATQITAQFIEHLGSAFSKTNHHSNQSPTLGQSSIEPNQLVLTYVDGVDSIWLISRTSSGSELLEIKDKKKIRSSLINFSVSLVNQRQIMSEYQRLANLLFPHSLLLGNQDLFIEPSVAMGQFPISSLLINYESLNSLSILSPSPQHYSPLKEESTSIVVFSNPVNFENQDDWRKNMPSLPWSLQELSFIKQSLTSADLTAFTDYDATKQTFFGSKAQSATILHVASHAYFNSQHPDIVGFTLSPQDDLSGTGFVNYTDIENARFNNALVIINGCDTAQGLASRVQVRSMAHAFLQAGANQSIGTLWPVSDKASALLMRIFYQQLAVTKNANTALRNAQNIMRKDFRYRHPFFWAGFTLYSSSLESVRIEI